tara:strand:+ start:167 stop:457 length:291 start_codon:yes stop_codon:yes gene_type:complete
MTDAPEKIWVHYEVETDDATWSEYPDTDGVADFKHYGEYTRADIAQARTADLEATLQWYALHVADCRKLGRDGDIARGKLDRDGGTKAREAMKATP